MSGNFTLSTDPADFREKFRTFSVTVRAEKIVSHRCAEQENSFGNRFGKNEFFSES